MKMHRWLLALLILPSLAAAPATEPVAPLVGPKFESQAAGIVVRPPLGSKTARGPVGSSEIVRFVNDDKKWILKISRVLLEAGKPLPLTTWKDAANVERPGMFELTIEQFKSDAPGAQMLRQEITKLGDHSMGQMAAKYDFGLETNLTQEAVIRTSDLQYYVLGMTSPAPRKGDIAQDPNVQQAVETFSQVIDSVEILDQTSAKDDRDLRLLRTRLLYANLNEAKLRKLVQGEQWLRITRDNKDVGYSYIVQDIARDLPRKNGRPEPASSPEGLRIGVRSRMIPQAGVQVDSECWYFTTFDRKYEAFSTLAYTEDPRSGKSTSGDIGFSQLKQRAVAKAGGIGVKPEVSFADDYKLEVSKQAQNFAGEPISRSLPPYYLPQALVQILPRIVDRREPLTYLFATWVPEASEVMYRYVDVEREQEVTFAGKRVRAVPVKDRTGLEGAVTTHYIAPDGQYLGSNNAETGITVIATDAATLTRIWRNGNLTRPGAVDR